MKHTLFISLVAASFVLAACGKQASENVQAQSVDETSMAVESAMKSLNDASGNNDQGAQQSSTVSSKASLSLNICTQIAALASCEAGVKTAVYSDCTPLFSGGTLQGNVQLTYSNMSCSVQAQGDSVTRTYDVTFTSRSGLRYEISSANHITYDGQNVGGGGKLTAEAGGAYQVEVMGQHRKILSAEGKELLDLSVHTSSAISVSAVVNNERTLDGGSVEVDHNLAHSKTVFTPHSLKFSAQCCYPVSGSLDVAFQGANAAAQGTINFKACGSAELVKDGKTSQIALNECE